MIYDFFSQTYFYIQACIDDLKTRSPLVLFLLFAPALFFDTVRYYVTNTIVFFLSIFKENRPEQEPLTAYSPMVTALVPVFNEGERIKHTLDALLESDYPSLEIIVIDDHSQDETSRICKVYQDKGLITYLRKTSGPVNHHHPIMDAGMPGEKFMFTLTAISFSPETQ